MKIWSTSKLTCTHSATDETFAHTLATFCTFDLKLSSGNAFVTLTGNKPEPSLGNHPCNTNAKLTSLFISPSLYWPLKEQLWVQIKDTFPIHTNPTSLNSCQSGSRIATKNTLCIDHILTNGEEMARWGEGGVLEMTAPSSALAQLQGREKHELAKEAWFAHWYCHSLQLWWPLQENCPIPLSEETQVLYTTTTEDYFKCNTQSRCSAVRLATTSWISALKVKKCSVDHFTHIPNAHSYTNLIRS